MNKPTFAHTEYVVDYVNKATANIDKVDYANHGWWVQNEYEQTQGFTDKHGNIITYTVIYQHAVKNIEVGR